MQDYQIRAVTSMAELEELRTFWKRVQWFPGADFEFFKVVIESRSHVQSPCVLVVSQNGQPSTLLAGRIETVRMPIRFGYASLAYIPIRQIVFIDGGFMGTRTEKIWRDLLLFIANFLSERRLDLALLEQVKVTSFEYKSARRTFNLIRLRHVHDPAEHWLLRLPLTWEDFLKSRSKKHRYWLKRLVSILDRDFAGRWSIKQYNSPAEVREFVESTEAVARKTYHRSLGVGFHLNDENLRRLELEAGRGQLRGYVLIIGGEPKAFWYCSIYQRTLYLEATGYDPACRSYEVGTVLLMRVFQDHCGTEVEVVDFGLGDAGYKQRFGSENFKETSLVLYSKSVRGYGLSLLLGVLRLVASVVRTMFNRLRITQYLKTRWRRKLEVQSNQSAELASGGSHGVVS